MTRIAVAQFGAGEDKAANLRRMCELVDRAAHAGATLVTLPEVAMATLAPERRSADWAEPLDGPFVMGLAEAARRNGIAVVAGVLEAIDGSDKSYNTAIVLGEDGAPLGSYRKVHMFDALGYSESPQTEPGAGPPLLFDHRGLRFGVAICYDLRFPELFRHLALAGADCVLLPAAWTSGPRKEHHWETLIAARAIENTIYLAAADQVGPGLGGGSAIIDPMGRPLAHATEGDDLVTATISGERLSAVRAVLPTLTHVRPEAYRAWRGA